MWGDETQAGLEEQSPRDQSKGRMRHESKYPLLEDCGKTKTTRYGQHPQRSLSAVVPAGSGAQ
jgi:hypothetical protein